jgi:1-acyl-sn-glycerol-3-phosphate acyltransferase
MLYVCNRNLRSKQKLYGLIEEKSFWSHPFIKRWLIRLFGAVTHRRYRGFNELNIEGSEIIRNLPHTNVLFISNHQTYFADVVAMFHVFNASLKGREQYKKCIVFMES